MHENAHEHDAMRAAEEPEPPAPRGRSRRTSSKTKRVARWTSWEGARL